MKEDVTKKRGSLPVCVGEEVGIEAGIHSINKMWSEEHTGAILPVDARNAFNLLIRQSLVHNISYHFPSNATFVKIVTVHHQGCLLQVERKSYQRKRATQGDPLPMAN